MSYAPSLYTGDGSTTNFAVPFPYISPNDVNVSVNGVGAVFTFLSSNLIQVFPAPAAAASVKVYRATANNTRNVVYANGVALTADLLNAADDQLFYLTQEASVTSDPTSALAAAAAAVVTANADVVLTHADVVLTHADVVTTAGAAGSATAAAASAATATSQAGIATTQATAAASSATTSSGAALTASGSATTATTQATAAAASKTAADADVVLTHADVVLTHADVTSANSSASTATTQASNASTSATNAANSASAAAASAGSVTTVPVQTAAAGSVTLIADTDLLATTTPGTPTLNKITWLNVKAVLKTYWDTVYQPLKPILTSIGNISVVTGDLIVGTGASTAARLAVGSNTNVLTVVAGVPAWAAATVYQAISTMLTSFTGLSIVAGDIVYGSAANTFARLAKATDGMVLTLVSGLPAWVAPVAVGEALIASLTASSGTTQNISGIAAGYSHFRIQLSGVVTPATNQSLQLSISSDGGSTFDTAVGIANVSTGVTVGALLFLTEVSQTASKYLSGFSQGGGATPAALITVGASFSIKTSPTNYLRFAWSGGGAFSGGTIRIYGEY